MPMNASITSEEASVSHLGETPAGDLILGTLKYSSISSLLCLSFLSVFFFFQLVLDYLCKVKSPDHYFWFENRIGRGWCQPQTDSKIKDEDLHQTCQAA